MVGTYSLSSGITALIKQLSHWRPRGEGIMGKQYPRLEISLLCKSAASLGQRCVMMWRTELGLGSGGWSDRGFRSCQETQTQRGQLEVVRPPRLGLKSTFSTVPPRRLQWFLLCNTPGRSGINPGLRRPRRTFVILSSLTPRWNIQLMESDADKSRRRLMNNRTFCRLYSSPLHYSACQ